MNVVLNVSFPRWLMPLMKFYAITLFIFSRRDEASMSDIMDRVSRFVVNQMRIEICDVA